MYVSGTKTGILYGLPKVHKRDVFLDQFFLQLALQAIISIFCTLAFYFHH